MLQPVGVSKEPIWGFWLYLSAQFEGVFFVYSLADDGEGLAYNLSKAEFYSFNAKFSGFSLREIKYLIYRFQETVGGITGQ